MRTLHDVIEDITIIIGIGNEILLSDFVKGILFFFLLLFGDVVLYKILISTFPRLYQDEGRK